MTKLSQVESDNICRSEYKNVATKLITNNKTLSKHRILIVKFVVDFRKSKVSAYRAKAAPTAWAIILGYHVFDMK